MGQIPSLKSLEVSYDFLPTCTMPVNVILMTTHDDAEGLKAYAEHPAHVAVGKELIKLVRPSTILSKLHRRRERGLPGKCPAVPFLPLFQVSSHQATTGHSPPFLPHTVYDPT